MREASACRTATDMIPTLFSYQSLSQGKNDHGLKVRWGQRTGTLIKQLSTNERDLASVIK